MWSSSSTQHDTNHSSLYLSYSNSPWTREVPLKRTAEVTSATKKNAVEETERRGEDFSEVLNKDCYLLLHALKQGSPPYFSHKSKVKTKNFKTLGSSSQISECLE